MIRNRKGEQITGAEGQDQLLGKLYGSVWGRRLLKLLVSPALSKAAGTFLSTRLSCFLIKPFIRSNGIDMEPYQPVQYRSYNEFFSRKIRPEMRPIDMDAAHLIAPCDSKLTALAITPDARFMLKNTEYTVASLLRNPELAAQYNGGTALVFRLTVDDYHRYCYPDSGRKEANIRLPGILHTVNPIANDHYPIYAENAREYCVLHADHLGDVIMMEVGALLVGRIVNHHAQATVARGEEKGYFQFGGSTVVMLLPKDAACIDSDILENSSQQIETVVHMGERIGCIHA